MRRITLTGVTTLAILVLLFGYRTSRDQSVTASTVAVGAAHVVSAGPAVADRSAAAPDPLTPTSVDRRAIPSTPASPSSSPTRPRRTTAPASTPSKSRPRATPAPSTLPKTSTTSAATTPTSTSSLTTKVDGAAVSTQYGDVQVEVTITNGRITDVQALQYPDQEPRDQQINGDALPQLQAQVLSAQSANISGVSGATFTTQGYIGSLQSALDAAKFK